jgi:hypothetical protein
MTDVAAAPLTDQAYGEAGLPQASATGFAELVWVHYRWEQAFHSGEPVPPKLEAEYRRRLGAFEEEHGQLLSAYWCRSSASAVTLTVKPAWGPLRYFGREPSIRFHRATDWLTRDAPTLAHVLHRCDALAIRASEVLRGTSERIALQLIVAVASHVLAFLDGARETPGAAAARKFARQEQRELDLIAAYYDRAASKAGRIVYFWGMMAGVLVLAMLAPILAGLLYLGGLWDGPNASETNLFFACYAAGALGALVSVLTRMASEKTKFVLDYEVGRKPIRRLGSFRPFIGAVFGLAVYFVVQSGVLQFEPPDEKEFYFFTTIAFLAGFSERFTKVILDHAETKLGDPEAGATEEEPEPSRPRRRAPAEDARVTDAAGEPVDVEALEQELSRAARGAEEVAEPRERDSA